jgi:nucleoside phosphorylase/CheY-like chemotaxis protein
MVAILLVEDEDEKRRMITATFTEVAGVTLQNIDFALDVVSAKRSLLQKRYDLLVLDINIPVRADRSVEVGAGLEVLRFIRTNPRAVPPTYIVGMTAYDDGFATASNDFASPLWKLVKFSYQEQAWREPLKAAIEYLCASNLPPYQSDGRTHYCDLGIVVALDDEELGSVRALNADWSPIPVRHDHARYFGGKFRADRSIVDVVAVAAPRMGMPQAAVAASKLIAAFHPRYLAICGICAGVRSKTEIGDILVADPCWDWGSGKWVRDKADGRLKFRPAAYQWRMDEPIRAGIKELASDTVLLERIYKEAPGRRTANPPRVLVEAMASGASVLQAEELMDDVREQHKNLIGVEMENFAVFSAAEYATEPRPKCVAIKAVCDFGEDDKGDDFHEYAAHNSARFLRELALKVMARETAE